MPTTPAQIQVAQRLTQQMVKSRVVVVVVVVVVAAAALVQTKCRRKSRHFERRYTQVCCAI